MDSERDGCHGTQAIIFAKRLVNVYKVRLSVYTLLNDRRIPTWQVKRGAMTWTEITEQKTGRREKLDHDTSHWSLLVYRPIDRVKVNARFNGLV